LSGRWPDGPGVIELPDGRRVRARGLRRPPLADLPGPEPDLGVYLLGARPPAVPWEAWWVRWPDFATPASTDGAVVALRAAWERAAGERVEVACGGGNGRTGTVIACMAVLAGHPAADALGWTRRHYRPRAVETPGQRRWIRWFAATRATAETGEQP